MDLGDSYAADKMMLDRMLSKSAIDHAFWEREEMDDEDYEPSEDEMDAMIERAYGSR